MRMKILIATTVLMAGAAIAAAGTTPAQNSIQEHYAALARAADSTFKQGDVERGRAFFQGRHTGGKAETPSCTTCHTSDLKNPGQTRAGKEIAPMAASLSPKRYTDPAEVEKWFKRNCSDVLGRECTPAEKSDALAYLLSL